MILTKSHLTNIVSRNVTVAWGGWYMAELAGSGLADVAGMVGLAKLMGREPCVGGKVGWVAKIGRPNTFCVTRGLPKLERCGPFEY